MFKVLKSNKGFTLVEVIVVAVIVLILAAVAIPLYNGYIRDSRRATSRNVAGTIVTFIGTAEQQNMPIALAGRTYSMTGTGADFFGDGAQVQIPSSFQVTITATSVEVAHCADLTNTKATMEINHTRTGATNLACAP